MVKVLLRMTQANMDVFYAAMVTKVHQVRSEASLPLRRRVLNVWCCLVLMPSGDHVSAPDVSDRRCKEGHGHPGEEPVFRSAGRQPGRCPLHPVLLLLISAIEGF